MTLDSLVQDMMDAAGRYPGIDLIWYYNAVSTIITVVSTFLGIVLTVIAVGLPLILAIELMFINFPPMTASLMEHENTVAAAGVEKKHRNWGLFVNDARKALRIHAETGKNINACYFQVKWKTMFAVAAVFNLLLFGADRIIFYTSQAMAELILRISM